MPVTLHFLDTHVAPELSKFTAADIPELRTAHPQSSSWLHNYILNGVFRGGVPSPEREYRYHFLRRVMIAFSEYDVARDRTYALLESRTNLTALFQSLHHWEQVLGASWHAIELLKRIARVEGDAFKRGDGSVEEAVNGLYNTMKHVEGRIETGQMPAIGTSPVWLTNEGLQGTDARVTFTDLAAFLGSLGNFAYALEDPRETQARLLRIREYREAGST